MVKNTVEVFDPQIPFAGVVYGQQHARMAIIGIGDGGLLVVSPGFPLSDECWKEIERLGEPRILLAPNHFHNAGIKPWSDKFPKAIVVAHPRAQPRLKKRMPGVQFQDPSALDGKLPASVRLLHPPSAKQGETWVAMKTKDGEAWFVTDAFINETRLPGGVMGLAFRLIGFRTKLMMNPLFKRLFLASKSELKSWVYEQLERDRPVLFVPSHGAPIRGPEVVSLLRRATEEG